ncbi:MAG: hypothetical protein KF760_32450 [Candidatus Eremiobacteraeota bacterium]|nr:hypothetical protein [Candidatus Eremiobacteraeota bacterium]MCW5872126.1 hypothetical protein [Candidatus Eremiobacteraeota bacterium]
MRKILLFFGLLLVTVRAQEVTQLSYFSDPFGNQGSFWKVAVQGQTYLAFKLKSPEKTGEATVVLDQALLAELEQKAAELKAKPNGLKADGFQVVWSKNAGDSKVSTLLGRWHGVKVKLIQVEENKNGKFEHQISLDKSYNDFLRALKKAKTVW